MAKYLTCLLVLAFFGASAQTAGFQKGSKVYVENVSKNEDALKTVDELTSDLKEWGYWKVVDKAAEADFKFLAETSVSKGIRATSWGGKSYSLVGKLAGKNNEVIWESNAYTSSPNGTNGFNSSKAVVKKLMRDLKKKFND